MADQTANDDVTTYLRRPAVLERVGLSCATIYRMMTAGTFPRAHRLSDNAVGWRKLEIDQWCDSRPQNQKAA